MFSVYIIKALCAFALFTPIFAITTPSDHIEYDNLYLSWKDHTATRFDFIFNPGSKLKQPVHESISALADGLKSCDGYSACLFRNSSHIFSYNISQTNTLRFGTKVSIFKSTLSNSKNDSKHNAVNADCASSNVTVFHYCSTHWNPPSHHTGSGCDHFVDWHSPYSCNETNRNHELPCYVHDENGGLIDLTPLVRSEGSSYHVNISENNGTISDFHLGVCNEAHDKCGAGVTACYTNRKTGLVESGYLNMTSVRYDKKEQVILMTSRGHYNSNCPDNRIKTITRFVCKNMTHHHIEPRLTRSTACEQVILWPTIQACQLPEIQSKGSMCALKYEKLGINVNLRQIMGNSSSIEIPDINIGGKSHKMVLGICRGLNSTSTSTCEGKRTKSTSACLIQSGLNTTDLSKNNSVIVGSITDSLISLSDTRLNLEYFVNGKPCEYPATVGFNSTRRLGTRIEFYCSDTDDIKPKFVGFNNCTYVLEWATSAVCFDGLGNTRQSNQTTKLNLNPPKSVDLPTKSSAEDKHKDTLGDASKIISKNKANPDIDNSHHFSEPTNMKENQQSAQHPTEASLPSSSTSKIASTSSSTQPTPKMLPINPLNAEVRTATKMSNLHRFFMISLILVSLTAFIVAIFILDRKTRLGLPLRAMRRQVRQTFQPQPVPYSRVSDFNDSLDL